LRHSYASLLIDRNENPKYIQTQMGHSSIKITLDVYGHLLDKSNKAAADGLAAQIFGNSDQIGSKTVAIASGNDSRSL
jgi:integrase